MLLIGCLPGSALFAWAVNVTTVSGDPSTTRSYSAWHLTSASASQPSNYNSGPNDDQNRMTVAAQNYNTFNPLYVTPDYSPWYALTQTGYGGNTATGGDQELPARCLLGSVIQSTTPEPGTILLLGAGLVIVGLAREKKSSDGK